MWPYAIGANDRQRYFVAICVGLMLCLFLPFVNKALHIDEWEWLIVKDHFGWNPLEGVPVSGYYSQGKIGGQSFIYSASHPMLIPYVLKVLQYFFGEFFIAIRMFFWFFPLLALWGLSRISSVCDPRGCNLLLLVLFCTLPAFVVNAQNLMTDVPTLAFLLAGTGLYVEGLSLARRGRCWWGGAAITCAVVSSYQAMAFIPVLMGFAWLDKKDGSKEVAKWMLPLLVPVVAMAIWLWVIYQYYGILPGYNEGDFIEGAISRGTQLKFFFEKSIYALAMSGGALLFVLPLRMLSASRRQWLCIASLFSLMVFLIFGVKAASFAEVSSPVSLAILCTFGVAGLLLATSELAGWWRCATSRPLAFLCGGWLAVTFGYNVLLMPFGSARYLLPLFPILFVVLLRGVDLSLARLRRVVAGCAVLSVLWGGANAWADYAYADVYRVMAAEVAEFRKTLNNGEQVWYIGEWGMRYYFDRAGARYLPEDSVEPRAGDFVIIPEMPRFWVPSPQLQPRLEFYASREFRSGLPLRLFNRRAGAGFYAHHWGLLPFALSDEPDEVFVLLQVR